MSPPWPLPERLDWRPADVAEPAEQDFPEAQHGHTRLHAVGRGGRYQLVRPLRTGGQARIWLARDTAAAGAPRGPDLVVKTILEEPDRQAAAVARSLRIAREARILDGLGGSPHVVPLRDWGPDPFREVRGGLPRPGGPGGPWDTRRPWLVLPLLPHWQLGESLASYGPWAAAQGAVIGRELACALAHLHDHGVVHRDVTPGNVLLTTSGVVLADLGMAWSARHGAPEDDDGERLISTGITRHFGAQATPGWCAPEGRSVDGEMGGGRPDRDPAVDVFGWGLFVGTAVTGRHPWSTATRGFGVTLGANDLQNMNKGGSPRRLRAEIPHPVLGELVEAALSPVPGDRPNAAELATALIDGVAPAPPPPAPAPDPEPTRAEHPPGHGSRRRTRVLTAAAVETRLAQAISTQWSRELGIRRLNNPHPLPVSWVPGPDDLFVPWSSIEATARHGAGAQRVPVGSAVSPAMLCGRGAELADVVGTRVPLRRLVVLGKPGAGKTMLLVRLVIDLLGDRAAIEGRIPFLVSLASWNPDDQDLPSWLRQLLVTDHPWLRQSGPDGAAHVDTLLGRHRLLPILDGLDEITAEARPHAIEKINTWLDTSLMNQVVVSSRSDEYARMVAPTESVAGARLSNSAGVLLEDLEPADVAQYLQDDAGSAAAAQRWAPVVEALGTDQPVDRALRVPLMVGLARTIYNPRGGEPLPTSDPGELCRMDRYPDRDAVERHLFEGFLPAAYREDRPAIAPDSKPPRLEAIGRRLGLVRTRRWSAERSAVWLRDLARFLGDPGAAGNTGGTGLPPVGGTNLRWWQLHRAVPQWVIGVVAGIVPGVAVGLAALWAPHPTAGGNGPAIGVGVGVGLLVGVLVALVLRRWAVPLRLPPRVAKWTEEPIARIAVGAAAAVAGSMLARLALQPFGFGHSVTGGTVGSIAVGLAVGPASGLLGGLVGGFSGGVAVGLTAGAGSPLLAFFVDGIGAGLAVGAVLIISGRLLPARGLRGLGLARGSAIAAGLVAGVAIGLASGVLAALVPALAGFCLGLLDPGADLRATTSPRVSLRRDRTTFLVFALVAAMTVGVGAGAVVAAIVGVAGGLSVGLAFGSMQAVWSRYTIARCLLAARGRLPWCLMAFLEDAHRRGVLRQVGAVYQFRHAKLQQYLAGR